MIVLTHIQDTLFIGFYLMIGQSLSSKFYWIAPLALEFSKGYSIEFFIKYSIALMLSNSKVLYRAFRIAQLPLTIKKYLNILLLSAGLITRNHVFLLLSLVFCGTNANQSNFRVKLAWILINVDKLVVDAWRLTDVI
jgi:hypothetical protein